MKPKQPTIPHCKTLFNLVRTKDEERKIKAACLEAKRWFARKYLNLTIKDQTQIECARKLKPNQWQQVIAAANNTDTPQARLTLLSIANSLKHKTKNTL